MRNATLDGIVTLQRDGYVRASYSAWLYRQVGRHFVFIMRGTELAKSSYLFDITELIPKAKFGTCPVNVTTYSLNEVIPLCTDSVYSIY